MNGWYIRTGGERGECWEIFHRTKRKSVVAHFLPPEPFIRPSWSSCIESPLLCRSICVVQCVPYLSILVLKRSVWNTELRGTLYDTWWCDRFWCSQHRLLTGQKTHLNWVQLCFRSVRMQLGVRVQCSKCMERLIFLLVVSWLILKLWATYIFLPSTFLYHLPTL